MHVVCFWGARLCVPGAQHSPGTYQMLSHGLMKEQDELEWLSLPGY